MIRAARVALALPLVMSAALAGAAQAQCADPVTLTGRALTGTWSVDSGAAQTMGAPMRGGSDEVVVQSSGGGITLVIEGRRIALDRVPPDAAGWTWEATEGVALTAIEAGVVLGCDINEMARFQGAAMGVTWRAMAATDNRLLIHWSMASPPSAGLFLVTR